jgi:hypothetical protein
MKIFVSTLATIYSGSIRTKIHLIIPTLLTLMNKCVKKKIEPEFAIPRPSYGKVIQTMKERESVYILHNGGPRTLAPSPLYSASTVVYIITL